jgi:hypothetical protein
MTHQVDKVTPKHDLTWYVKWIACFFVLIAVACRSVEEVPKIYDVVFSLTGTLGWLWVGYIWHDRAIIVLNGVLSFLLATSVLRYFT